MKISYQSVLLVLLAQSAAGANLRGGSSSDHHAIHEFTPNQRILDEDEEMSKSSSMGGTRIPYSNQCELGSGFNAQTSRCGTSAIDHTSIRDCSETSGNEACFFTNEAVGQEISYSHTSTSFDQNSDLMSIVANAEGSWGPLSGSMGVDYMMSSGKSTNSFSFYIGQNIDWKRRHYFNFRDLRLTDSAFQLLQTNPARFVLTHGRSFVHNIQYGASFLGSATMTSTNSTETESMEAFARIQYSTGIFTLAGSGNFSQVAEQSAGSVDIRIDARLIGGGMRGGDRETAVNFPRDDPKQLGDYFNTWSQSVSVDNVVPRTMNTIDFLQLQQVSDYISTAENGEEIRQLLTDTPLTSIVTEEVLREELLTTAVLNTITRALNFNCLSRDAARSLNRVRRQVAAHASTIQGMTFEDYLAVQVQIQSRNWEFFVAEEFQKEVDDIIENGMDEECLNAPEEPERVPFPHPPGVVHKIRSACSVAGHQTNQLGRLVLRCPIEPTRAHKASSNRNSRLVFETDNDGCEVQVSGIHHWNWQGVTNNGARTNSLFFMPTRVGGSDASTIRAVNECLTPGSTIVGYWRE